MLDTPIKTVESRVVQSDGVELLVNFQLPEPEASFKPQIISYDFLIDNPVKKYPDSDSEFFGIQVYCGYDRSENLCETLKKKFRFNAYNCKQVSPSPVEQSGCKRYLYGNYKTLQKAQDELAELKRKKKYDSAEPFKIFQVGIDPYTRQFSYRNNKFYAIRLACRSTAPAEIEIIRNQFSKFDLDTK